MFQVLKKKVSFSALSLVQLPLGVLLKVKGGATKRMKFFSSFCCIILLQQGCNNPVLQPCTMVVTVSITRLNTRLLQPEPCFMVVTTLNYNLVTTLLHPCNKVVISVWDEGSRRKNWGLVRVAELRLGFHHMYMEDTGAVILFTVCDTLLPFTSSIIHSTPFSMDQGTTFVCLFVVVFYVADEDLEERLTDLHIKGWAELL